MKRILLLALGVCLLGGCQAQTAFRIAAIEELGSSLAQLEKGALEAQVGLLARCDMRDEQAQMAATNDLVGIATDAEYDDAKKTAEVTTKMVQLQLIRRDIDTDRARGTERFRRMSEQTAFARLLLSKMLTLERQAQSTEAQLAEYRVLAEDYARRLFGLVHEPAPAIIKVD